MAATASALSCDARRLTFPNVLTDEPIKALANDGSDAYWMSGDAIGWIDGQSGAVTTLAESAGTRPSALYADTTGAYWINESGALLHVRAGHSAALLASVPGAARAFAIGGDLSNIYLPGYYEIYGVRKQDGAVTTIFSQSNFFVVSNIAASNGNVCWIGGTLGASSTALTCVSTSDPTPRTIATGVEAGSLAMSEENIFFIANGTIERSAGQPNDAEPLASLSGASVWPTSLQADEHYLYWIGHTAYGEGLFATGIAGSTTTLLVPSSLYREDTRIMDAVATVSTTFIFWATGGSVYWIQRS